MSPSARLLSLVALLTFALAVAIGGAQALLQPVLREQATAARLRFEAAPALLPSAPAEPPLPPVLLAPADRAPADWALALGRMLGVRIELTTDEPGAAPVPPPPGGRLRWRSADGATGGWLQATENLTPAGRLARDPRWWIVPSVLAGVSLLAGTASWLASRRALGGESALGPGSTSPALASGSPDARTFSTLARQNAAQSAELAAARAARDRLRRDLHDTVAQTAYAAALQLEALQRRWGAAAPAAETEALARTARSLRELNREVRAYVDDLERPLGSVALGPALEHVAAAFRADGGPDLVCEVGSALELPGHQVEEIAAIVRESVGNAVRHAGARRIDVRLRPAEGSDWLVEVQDDGRGFDPAAPVVASPTGGHGLAHLRERAAALGATLDLASAPGAGTLVRLRLPLASLPP